MRDKLAVISGDDLDHQIQQSFAKAQQALLEETRELLSSIESQAYMLKKWLTLDDIVLYFGGRVKRQTIARSWLKSGLKHSKVGQIVVVHIDDLESYCEANRVKTSA